MASFKKIHSLSYLVQDVELWRISSWNRRIFFCFTCKQGKARGGREGVVRGEACISGGALKKNPPLAAVFLRALASARLKR